MRRKFSHIEKKNVNELGKDITEAKIELLSLRMQHAQNTLKNPLLIRAKRRLVARLNTVMTLKNRGTDA